MGDRERLKIDQAIHGRDDVEGLHTTILLLRVSALLDLLVQVELTGEYEHSPLITADNTFTLLMKMTGIG